MTYYGLCERIHSAWCIDPLFLGYQPDTLSKIHNEPRIPIMTFFKTSTLFATALTLAIGAATATRLSPSLKT